MKQICAWCQKELTDTPTDSPHISHGICRDCAFHLRAGQGLEFEKYLEALRIPIVVMDAEAHVLFVTSALKSTLEIDDTPPPGLLAGILFECENAFKPGGCGNTIHCDGCAVRHSITDTARNNLSHNQVSTCLKNRDAKNHRGLQLTFTTHKSGDVVILRIDHSTAIDLH